LWRLGSRLDLKRAHNPKVPGSNPFSATMNDEGLADVEAANPNQRWCSDVFLIPCWSGEVISVAFAIDCHDREVSGLRRVAAAADGRRQSHADGPTLWARFGEATLKAPHAVQWLSDNGPQYTATATVLYAHELGLVPVTTPAYSPQRATVWPRPS